MILHQFGFDSGAGDKHLVDIIHALAAKLDLEGSACLAAGGVNETDIGSYLCLDCGRHCPENAKS